MDSLNATNETIKSLSLEIRRIKDLILFYENKVLRIEKTIDELMGFREIIIDNPNPLEVEQIKQQSVVTNNTQIPIIILPTVPQMLEEVIPTLNGKVFWYSDLKTEILKIHPQAKSKIKAGIYPAVYEMIKNGRILKVPNGLQLK